MTSRVFLLALLALAIAPGFVQAQPKPLPPLPTPILPDGLGVNIHFTDPKPGEMEMLAAGGFRWVRMDFAWGGIEREKGKYDFAAYDRLLAALDKYGIRPVLILDYANKFYDEGLSPHTDEGRAAFARWAAAAALHFKGRGVIWEMFNEPNIGFWKPTPNVDDYAKLALAVGQALRAAAPDETYIGAGTSGLDFKFLEACFKAGLLDYWTAVSVHPYRQNEPESAARDYRRLRLLIAQYAPKGKTIPILSGEWGYSSAWGGMSDEKQGKMLPRQWLTNISNDVPLSIWYDWHDDGLDPKEPEHHFGTVNNPYHEGRDPVYDPKPSYVAAKTLTTALNGYRFNKRLALDSPDDYVLLFEKGDAVRLVAWTTGKPHEVVIPASPGGFSATGYLGDQLPALVSNAGGLKISLTDTPQYLTPAQSNRLLRIAATWPRAPLELMVEGPKLVTLDLQVEGAPGAVTTPAQVKVLRSDEPVLLRNELRVQGATFHQSTPIIVTNPLRITVQPPVGKILPVRLENPAGTRFNGTLALRGSALLPSILVVSLQAGETQSTIDVPLKATAPNDFRVAGQVLDATGVVLDIPITTFHALDDFSRYTAATLPNAWVALPDGDAKVASEQTLSVVPPDAMPAAVPTGLPAGLGALKVSYRFDPGWKFLRVAPRTAALSNVAGQPKALGLWIYGDASGQQARLRVTDATGQTFQPGGEAITWQGWRYVTFLLDPAHSGYWGGANDGVIHFPIRLDTLFLLDNGSRKAVQGEVLLSGPVWIF